MTIVTLNTTVEARAIRNKLNPKLLKLPPGPREARELLLLE